jgi:hypothetical protein
MSISVEPRAPLDDTPPSVCLNNDSIELVLPVSYGPRIARYASPSGPNLLAEVSPHVQRVKTGFGDDWHIYGGHRLWTAPEHAVDSYYPDNAPVEVERTGATVSLRQRVEPHSGLEKIISVTLHQGTHVSVHHELVNRGDRPRNVAAWALTAMAPGGTAIFPQSWFAPHPQALAPARPLVLWPFTRMADPRSSWGDRFILLRQDSARPEPQKFGFYNDRGYMAYLLGQQLFIKCHMPLPGLHADFGGNAQSFTNELFLELETLGPVQTLAPGERASHREDWFLFDGFSCQLDDSDLSLALSAPLAQAAQQLGALGQHELSALLQRTD